MRTQRNILSSKASRAPCLPSSVPPNTHMLTHTHCAHIHAYVCTHAHSHIPTPMCTHMYTLCSHMCAHTCTHACMYTHTWSYAHTHSTTPGNSPESWEHSEDHVIGTRPGTCGCTSPSSNMPRPPPGTGHWTIRGACCEHLAPWLWGSAPPCSLVGLQPPGLPTRGQTPKGPGVLDAHAGGMAGAGLVGCSSWKSMGKLSDGSQAQCKAPLPPRVCSARGPRAQ